MQQPRTSTYRMADRLLGGQLGARLTELRAEGLSWEDIAKRLHVDGVEVSGETLRAWGATLAGVDKAPA